MRDMIQNAPLGVFVLMVLFPLAMAGVLVFAGLRARRQSALMASTKPVPIGMAEDGYRQFEGTAEAIGGQTLRAPLTGSECVWYDARVEEFKTVGSGSHRRSDWQVVRSVTSSAPLLVRDATGACVVRVLDAEVTPRDKSRWTGATLEPEDRNPPRLGPQESWPMVEVAGGSTRFRYHETRIYPGDPLTVVGQFLSHKFDRTASDDEDDDVLLEGETAADLENGGDGGDDEDDDTDDAASAAPGGSSRAWAREDAARQDALDELALAVTKAEIMAGGRGQPLILAATSAATHAHMTAMGAQAAFMVALVPLALAGLVLLARFG